MSRLELAIDQIIAARSYTEELLDQTPATDWFRQPPAGITHIGWQVGHLAFAQYRLTLWRIRGSRPEDAGLFSDEFVRCFGPESVPDPDASKNPPLVEIRAVFDRVHQAALAELSKLAEAELDQPVANPHPFAPTKLLAMYWCARHEMLHAGQIGLLRRQLGHPPL